MPPLNTNPHLALPHLDDNYYHAKTNDHILYRHRIDMMI